MDNETEEQDDPHAEAFAKFEAHWAEFDAHLSKTRALGLAVLMSIERQRANLAAELAEADRFKSGRTQ